MTLTRNTYNPFALILGKTKAQKLVKHIKQIEEQIETEELRLIDLQFKRDAARAQLAHLDKLAIPDWINQNSKSIQG